MSNPNPRYVHGIPVRTVAEGDQQDSFIEETEGRRGVFYVMNDGFTCRQGTDIMAHMSKNGSFYPRRYVTQMDIGFNTDDENSYDLFNLIICEDGPRITISFPHIGPLTQANTGSGNMTIQSLNSALPRKISPVQERGEYYFSCFALVGSIDGSTGSLIKTQQILSFHLRNDDTFEFQYSSPQIVFVTYVEIFPFCVTYDTGNYI